jgi:hypothetical protein
MYEEKNEPILITLKKRREAKREASLLGKKGAKMEETNKSKTKERTRRVPLGVPRARLAVNEREGYVRRWINDRDGRILRAQNAGYNFVKREDVEFIDSDVCNTDSISKVVNSDGTKAFLMEISKEFYDEDQKEKNKIDDRTEEALRHGIDSHGAPGRDGRYIPKEGIKITNN